MGVYSKRYEGKDGCYIVAVSKYHSIVKVQKTNLLISFCYTCIIQSEKSKDNLNQGAVTTDGLSQVH